MKTPRVGKLRLAGAHRWRDIGSKSLFSLCGLKRMQVEVDFRADFMWPTCQRCAKAWGRQRVVLAKARGHAQRPILASPVCDPKATICLRCNGDQVNLCPLVNPHIDCGWGSCRAERRCTRPSKCGGKGGA